MDLKKYFIGVLILFAYINMSTLAENVGRFIVKDFETEKMITIYTILLIILHLILIGIIFLLVKKRGNNLNKFFTRILIIAILIFFAKTASNFLLGSIDSESYINNSSELLSSEVLVKGVLNILLFISLSVYFLNKKDQKTS